MYQSAIFKSYMLMATMASSVVLLSACGALEDLDKWSIEQYRQKCINMGIQPGSPSFDECMLQQQKLEEEGLQHSMDRSAMERRNKHH